MQRHKQEDMKRMVFIKDVGAKGIGLVAKVRAARFASYLERRRNSSHDVRFIYCDSTIVQYIHFLPIR